MCSNFIVRLLEAFIFHFPAKRSSQKVGTTSAQLFCYRLLALPDGLFPAFFPLMKTWVLVREV